ncbi:MAG TPA: fused MFS/spermidine synthase [Candidatus Hydrogenedentes bacterium]|nr:fused MFS/spermidine synthase [Candidatus Hydrogenedentota bacterium]
MDTSRSVIVRFVRNHRLGLRELAVFLAVLGFFFVSGACGLLYQVIWTRKLVLLFGTAAYAVSTVLSIYFLGLALGSLWGGRLADRIKNPLGLYGLFEVLIGAWAVLFILAIGPAEGLIVPALRAFAGQRAVAIGLRAVMSLGFLLVPVVLMGATLPLLAKFVSTSARTRGLRIGTLYSINTFGAVSGCAFTGFWLLSEFGYFRTTLAGAAANAVAGLLAIGLSKLAAQGAAPATTAESTLETAGTSFSGGRAALVVGVFALSGFCALALEVVWTRLLVLVFTGTTYAFTTMLVAMLCGIAVGSAVAAFVADRVKSPAVAFGVIEMLIGVACILMLRDFARIAGQMGPMMQEVGYKWAGVLRGKFLLSFSVLFLPTFLFGMTFPFVVRAVTAGRERLGRDIGRVYSANTLGGVLGSLAGGFLIIPLLGTHWGVVALAGALFGGGLVVTLASPARSPVRKGIAIVGAVVLLAAAVFSMPGNVGMAVNKAYLPEKSQILHYDEGVEGTVVVAEEKEEDGVEAGRYLWINAMQATASIEKGVRMNRLQGALPLMFSHEPENVLFMCFGSGITAGTLGLSDAFKHIDAVELSKEVLGAARYFTADNLNVIANPKIEFIIDDGRNFLLTSGEQYDLITFEPMPLAQAGVSTFYTREYYELCLAHLAPGGVVSQWVPLHSLNPEIVRSLVYTFTTVFPDYCAWFVNADLFLTGSNQPLVIELAALRRRLENPAVSQALAAAGFHDIPELLASYFMGKAAIDVYAEGGRLMTDDRPWAEFAAPKLMYERHVSEALEELIPHFESPLDRISLEGTPEDAREPFRGAMERRYAARRIDLDGINEYYGGMMGSNQEDHFIEALKADPEDFCAQYYLLQIVPTVAKQYMRWEEYDKGIDLLAKTLTVLPDNLGLMLTLADFYYAKGDMPQALSQYMLYKNRGGGDQQALERIREMAPEASQRDASPGDAAPAAPQKPTN